MRIAANPTYNKHCILVRIAIVILILMDVRQVVLRLVWPINARPIRLIALVILARLMLVSVRNIAVVTMPASITLQALILSKCANKTIMSQIV